MKKLILVTLFLSVLLAGTVWNVFAESDVATETEMNPDISEDSGTDDDTESDTEVVVCGPGGDANSDGKVNISDVSLALMYISDWSDLVVDAEQIEVTGDGKVNLSDVSKMLMYVAKWSAVRIEHTDTVEILATPSCKAEGKAKLTCTRCGDATEVICNIIPCKYEETIVSEANCTTPGMAKYTCTMCGDNYTRVLHINSKHDFKYGFCENCVIAKDPDCAGRANVIKLSKYCNWLTQNGSFEDGEYFYIGYTENWAFTTSYYPSEKLFEYGILMYDIESNVIVAIIIEIQMDENNISRDHKEFYMYSLWALDGTTGEELAFFDGFINPVLVKEQDWELVMNSHNTFGNGYDFLHSCRKAGLGIMRVGLENLGVMLDIADVGITPEDLGFKGY